MDHHLVSNYETFKLIKADFLQKGIQAERFNGEHINDDGTRRYLCSSLDTCNKVYYFINFQIFVISEKEATP